MDIMQFLCGLYSITLVIRGCFGSLVLAVGPWDTTDRPCHKKCKYGYEADVEGNTMCKCLDPCAHIYCPFEGTRCVVRRSDKFCRHGYCKYEATCKKVTNQRRKKLLKLDNYQLSRYKNEVYYGVQGDSSDNSVIDLCSRQPSVQIRYRCYNKSAGYYYDGLKGTCVRFKGCHSNGDFFTRRKDCKRSCIKHRNSDLYKKTHTDCTLPIPDWTKCGKLKRVWNYDQLKRKCVKSKGCSYTGNSFPTRLQCKKSCKKNNSKSFLRRIHIVS